MPHRNSDGDLVNNDGDLVYEDGTLKNRARLRRMGRLPEQRGRDEAPEWFFFLMLAIILGGGILLKFGKLFIDWATGS